MGRLRIGSDAPTVVDEITVSERPVKVVEVPVEVEKVVEVIKEVPVNVVIEKIVEIPVEVEKIVEIEKVVMPDLSEHEEAIAMLSHDLNVHRNWTEVKFVEMDEFCESINSDMSKLENRYNEHITALEAVVEKQSKLNKALGVATLVAILLAIF